MSKKEIDKLTSLSLSRISLLKALKVLDEEIETVRKDNPLTSEEMIKMFSYDKDGKMELSRFHLLKFVMHYFSLTEQEAIKYCAELVNNNKNN